MRSGFLCEELCRVSSRHCQACMRRLPMWRPCQTSHHPCRTATLFYMTAACWQSSHFPPFFPVPFTLFSNSAKRQGKAASKFNPLWRYNSNRIMNDASPSETMKYTVGVWHSCLQEALVNICCLRRGCRSVKSCHLVTMSWKYWRKFQYPDHERGMIFSESPRWEQGGNHRDQNVTAASDCEVLLIREGEWQDLNAGNICEERFH